MERGPRSGVYENMKIVKEGMSRNVTQIWLLVAAVDLGPEPHYLENVTMI